MMTFDNDLYSNSYTVRRQLLSPVYKAYPANVTIKHWQLRDLVCVTPKRSHEVIYPRERNIYALNLYNGHSRHVTTFDFEPRCIQTHQDVIAVGAVQDNHRSSIRGTSSGTRGLFAVHNRQTRMNVSQDIGDCINNSITLYSDNSVSGEAQVKAIICNNDQKIYFVDIENSRIKVTGKTKFDCALNHASISPDKKTILACGDTKAIFVCHPEEKPRTTVLDQGGGRLTQIRDSPWSVSQIMDSSTEYGFSAAFHPSGLIFGTAFQPGIANFYDMRNLSEPLTRIYSTRPKRFVGAFRCLKFAQGLADTVFISEQTGRVHAVDLRDFENHQILHIPKTLNTSLNTRGFVVDGDEGNADGPDVNYWTEYTDSSIIRNYEDMIMTGDALEFDNSQDELGDYDLQANNSFNHRPTVNLNTLLRNSFIPFNTTTISSSPLLDDVHPHSSSTFTPPTGSDTETNPLILSLIRPSHNRFHNRRESPDINSEDSTFTNNNNDNNIRSNNNHTRRDNTHTTSRINRNVNEFVMDESPFSPDDEDSMSFYDDYERLEVPEIPSSSAFTSTSALRSRARRYSNIVDHDYLSDDNNISASATPTTSTNNSNSREGSPSRMASNGGNNSSTLVDPLPLSLSISLDSGTRQRSRSHSFNSGISLATNRAAARRTLMLESQLYEDFIINQGGGGSSSSSAMRGENGVTRNRRRHSSSINNNVNGEYAINSNSTIASSTTTTTTNNNNSNNGNNSSSRQNHQQQQSTTTNNNNNNNNHTPQQTHQRRPSVRFSADGYYSSHYNPPNTILSNTHTTSRYDRTSVLNPLNLSYTNGNTSLSSSRRLSSPSSSSSSSSYSSPITNSTTTAAAVRSSRSWLNNSNVYSRYPGAPDADYGVSGICWTDFDGGCLVAGSDKGIGVWKLDSLASRTFPFYEQR